MTKHGRLGIALRQTAEHVDALSQRRPLQSQAAMHSQQVLDRLMARVGFIQLRGGIQHQGRRTRNAAARQRIEPLRQFGEIEHRNNLNQVRLFLALLNRVRAQPARQQVGALPQALIDGRADLALLGGELLDSAWFRRRERVQLSADIVHEATVVHHGWGFSSVGFGRAEN
ncbi:MAG TPA: hypothetical protein VHV55_06170 [Pirellulales bacterium]|nr:hypothetical protein [Pirellulales bacterium]